MKVLTYTTLFPNNVFPNHGVFIKERMRFFAQRNELKVVAPVPYFPGININTRWYKYSKIKKFEIIEDIPVWHPRYFITPRIGMSLYGDYLYWSTKKIVAKILSSYTFEAIDAHYIYPDGYAALKIAKEFNKPIILSARGTDINLYSEFPIIKKKLLFTMQSADRIIAVSQSLKDRIHELGIPEYKIEVIPNGVDFDKFYKMDKMTARKELNLPLDKKIILSVGLLIDRKGFNFLIDAFGILIKNMVGKKPPVLIIAGEGERKVQLQTQINKNKLQDCIKLVGSIPHNQLNKYYNAADIFTLVSSREGWPNAVMEALACGVPVVATKIWGIPEIIKNDSYGILVEDQDPQKIYDGLNTALHRRWDTDKIYRYSREFGWNDVAKKVEDQFKLITPGK